MRRKMPIFYSALMLTGVNLLLRFVSTAFQVYLSGRIGAAGIGLLQLVLSVGALAMTAGIAGIRTATMYLTAEELGKNRAKNVTWVLSACFFYSILCSGAVAGLLYFLAPQISVHWIGDPATESAIRIYAGVLPIYCLCGVMVGYFTAANRIGTLAAVEVAEQLVSMTITMLLLTLWAGADPVRACQSVILGSGLGAVMTLLCLVLLRLRECQTCGKRIPIARRLTQVAAPLALADNLKAGISTTENLMVPKRLSLYPGTAAPLAAFGMVCGMVFPILMFPAAIVFGLAELLIPELARCNAAGSDQRIQYLVKRSLRVTFLYGCILCGLEILLAEELCLRLYKSYDAGQHLRLYAIMIPMLYCDAITDAMTKGLGQQKVCVRYNINTSLLDVVFLFFLLPKYGMMGYLFSFFITHLLNFILSLRRLIRTSHCRITAGMPIMGILSTILAVTLSFWVVTPIMRSVCFIAIILCLYILFGVVKKEDVRWIKGLFQGKSHNP